MKYKLILWIMVILALSVSVMGATAITNCAGIVAMTSGVDYVLSNDIDCTGTTMTPTTYSATFDGAGYTISNINHNVTANSQGVIFGTLTTATISDVTIANSYMLSGDYQNIGYWGAIGTGTFTNLHFNNATIDTVTGVATTKRYGLIVGLDQSSTFNDISVTDSTVDGANNDDIGLLVGQGSASSTYNNITLTDSTVVADDNGGGIVGLVAGDIQLSNATISGVTVTLSGFQAGFVTGMITGGSDTTISDVTINNSLFGVGTVIAGGVLGSFNPGANVNLNIDGVHWDTQETGDHQRFGLIGGTNGVTSSNITINNSYVTGNVTIVNQEIGAFMGWQSDANINLRIDNSYSSLTFMEAYDDVGAFCGECDVGVTTVTNSFAVNGVFNITTAKVNHGGAIGLSTAGNVMTNVYWQNSTNVATSCEANPSSNAGCTVENTLSAYYPNFNSWDTSVWDFHDSNLPTLDLEGIVYGVALTGVAHRTPTVSEISQVTPVTVTSTSYVPIISGNFDVNVTGTLDIGVTGDIEGLGGSTIATCKIVFNGTDYETKTSSPDNNQHKSFFLQSSIIENVSIGNYNVSFECKKDSSSRFLIEASELLITEYYDGAYDPVNVAEYDIAQTQVVGSTYVKIGSYNFTAGLTESSNTSLYDKNLILKSQIQFEHITSNTANIIYEIGGINYSTVYRTDSIGGSGTGSFFAMHNMTALPDTNVLIEIYANAPTHTNNITIKTIMFETFGHKGEFASNQNTSTSVLTGTAWQTVNTHNIEISSHTGVAIVSYASIVADTPGSSDDLSFRLNLVGIENGSTLNRDIISSNDGIITIDQDFLNLTSGNYTVQVQARSTFGGSISQIERVAMVTFTANEIFTVTPTYKVYAYRHDTGLPLSGFNVTIESNGNVYTDATFVEIPVSVALENITIELFGFNTNITLLHNTSTNLNASMVYNLLAPSLVLTLTPSDSNVVGTTTTASGTSCPATLTCTLYRDGVNVSNPDVQNLSVGSYVYVYNTTGSINYSSESITDTLYITALSDPVCLLFTDQKVYYNTSHQWASICSSPVNLLSVELTCDDGFSFSINPNATSYVITNSSNLITSNVNCVLNATDVGGTSSVYYQLLNPAQGGELIYGMCPIDDQGFTMLWIIVAIAGFLSILALVSNIPLMYFISGIMTITASWYLAGCVVVVYMVLLVVGILQLVKGFFEITTQR